MFQVQLVPSGNGHFVVKVLKTISPGNVQPAGHAVQVGAAAGPPGMNPPILATRNLGLDIGGAHHRRRCQPRGCRGRAARDHRPERRRQDVALQPALGHLPADRGHDRARGRDITQQPTFRRTREGLGRTFQVSSVFPLLQRARERRGSRPRRRSAGRCGSGGAPTSVTSALERAHAALERVGLDAVRAWTQAGALAHGDKRRLEIAMLLAADKPVLMLDEPMAGLSAEHVPQLVELIRCDPHRRSGRRC